MTTKSDVQTEAQNLEEIDLVGNVRRKKLRGEGYVNAGDVAEADPDEMYEEVSGLSKGDAEKIVNNARQLIGAEAIARVEREDDPGHNFPMATIPSEATDDEDENKTPNKHTPDEDEDLVDESMTIDELLENEPDPEPQPEECKKVLFIGGQGAFDYNGEYGDLNGEEKAQLILQRINEFGFTNTEEVGILDQGMSRKTIIDWLRIQKETGNKTFEPKIFKTRGDGSPGKEEYQDRNERAIEWADGICVIANGEYIGMWVNMTRGTSTAIRTPQMEDEDEEDESEDDE